MDNTDRETLWEERDQGAADVERAFSDASELRSKFLQRHGWEYSCHFPDSVWRWAKRYGDERLMLNAADAFEMEKDHLEPRQNIADFLDQLNKGGKPK